MFDLLINVTYERLKSWTDMIVIEISYSQI